jgi:hypothetical protein
MRIYASRMIEHNILDSNSKKLSKNAFSDDFVRIAGEQAKTS